MKLRNKRFARSRRSRQGFTLLELMLVMAILVVLAGLATFAVLPMLGTANSGAAGVEIQTLANACKLYKLRLNAFPNTLQDLSSRPSGIDQNTWGGPFVETPIVNDPWNRPYKYTPNDATNTVLIQSAGPDGQFGSEDDVSNAQNTQ